MKDKKQTKSKANRGKKKAVSSVGVMDEKKRDGLIAELVERGREQGFVTQDEILEVFPDAERVLDKLDDLYTKLIAEAVDVFESVADGDMGDPLTSTELEKELG